jgi:hypothetical protein
MVIVSDPKFLALSSKSGEADQHWPYCCQAYWASLSHPRAIDGAQGQYVYSHCAWALIITKQVDCSLDELRNPMVALHLNVETSGMKRGKQSLSIGYFAEFQCTTWQAGKPYGSLSLR